MDNNNNNNNNEIKNPFLNLNISNSNNEQSTFNQINNNENNNSIINNNQINNDINIISNNNTLINNAMKESIELSNDNSNINNSNSNSNISNEMDNNEKIDLLLGINKNEQIQNYNNNDINNSNSNSNTNISNEIDNNEKIDLLLGINKNEQIQNYNNNNINNSNNIKKSDSSLGLVLLIIDIIGFILVFIGSIYGLVGASLGLICFVISLINHKKKIKYIKISLITSFILFAIYLIMIVISTNTVNDYLYDTKANVFKFDASSYIDSARTYYKKNSNILECKENNSITVPLNILSNEMEYKLVKSPFGNKYDLNSSYVKIESLDDNCIKINWYIYFTDGEYSIGEPNKPLINKEFEDHDYKLNK